MPRSAQSASTASRAVARGSCGAGVRGGCAAIALRSLGDEAAAVAVEIQAVRRRRARTLAVSPTVWMRTPCACDTQVPPASAKCITLSRAADLADQHRRRCTGTPAPPAGRTWCGRSATVMLAVGQRLQRGRRGPLRAFAEHDLLAALVRRGDVDRRVGEHARAGQVGGLAVHAGRGPNCVTRPSCSVATWPPSSSASLGSVVA